MGGKTQGLYQLLLKFEPQANESDTIRDLDSTRVGVPGTALDGDNDGTPGGAYNFWFQTRPLDRTLEFTANGSAIVPGQNFTITGSNGVVRRFEFVPLGGTVTPGNVAISYNPGATAVAQAARRLLRTWLLRCERQSTQLPQLLGCVLRSLPVVQTC